MFSRNKLSLKALLRDPKVSNNRLTDRFSGLEWNRSIRLESKDTLKKTSGWPLYIIAGILLFSALIFLIGKFNRTGLEEKIATGKPIYFLFHAVGDSEEYEFGLLAVLFRQTTVVRYTSFIRSLRSTIRTILWIFSNPELNLRSKAQSPI